MTRAACKVHWGCSNTIKLDVLSVLDPVLRFAHRNSKQEEMEAVERMQVGTEAADRRLKSGLWLVNVRRCQEKEKETQAEVCI